MADIESRISNIKIFLWSEKSWDPLIALQLIKKILLKKIVLRDIEFEVKVLFR